MADMKEIDAAFSGIFEEPVADGVNDTDPAAPEGDNTDNNPAAADDDTADGGDGGNTGTQEPAAPAQQTADENAKYAAARRKAEQQAAREIERIRAEEQAKYAAQRDADIAEMGLMNPYTGQMIKTHADMVAYRERHMSEQQQNATAKMDDAGLSEEERLALIESDPRYQEAMKMKAKVEALEEKAKAADESAKQTRAQKTMEDAVALIKKDDPAIQTVQDLLQHPKADDIYKMVQQGYSIAHAYQIVNHDEIVARQVEAAIAQTRNNINGKSHMGGSVPHGDGGVNLTADQIAEFRAINPGASVDQIRAFVARDSKRTKRK